MYYYSSGYIDDAKVKVLQGVVKVDPLVDKSNEISVRVGGMEARHVIGGRYDIEHFTHLTYKKPAQFRSMKVCLKGQLPMDCNGVSPSLQMIGRFKYPPPTFRLSSPLQSHLTVHCLPGVPTVQWDFKQSFLQRLYLLHPHCAFHLSQPGLLSSGHPYSGKRL